MICWAVPHIPTEKKKTRRQNPESDFNAKSQWNGNNSNIIAQEYGLINLLSGMELMCPSSTHQFSTIHIFFMYIDIVGCAHNNFYSIWRNKTKSLAIWSGLRLILLYSIFVFLCFFLFFSLFGKIRIKVVIMGDHLADWNTHLDRNKLDCQIHAESRRNSYSHTCLCTSGEWTHRCLNLQFSVARIFAALAGSKTHSPFDILNIKLNTNKLIV